MYDPKKITGNNHRDLESLHPIVASLAKQLLTKAQPLASPYLLKIVSTLRTWPEQQAIYNQGRTTPGLKVTNALPGDSIHNWGCAFDVGVFSPDGKVFNPKGSEEILQKIAPLGKALGLFWGGDFTSPKDYPHYQFTGKYSNSEFLRLAKSGKSIDELLDPLGHFIQGLNK